MLHQPSRHPYLAGHVFYPDILDGKPLLVDRSWMANESSNESDEIADDRHEFIRPDGLRMHGRWPGGAFLPSSYQPLPEASPSFPSPDLDFGRRLRGFPECTDEPCSCRI